MAMNFEQTCELCEVIVKSGCVPFIVGHAGIGKSQVPKAMKKLFENQGEQVEIEILFGSVLKDGELGGMPVTTRDEEGRLVNDYTTHVKLRRILDNAKKGIKTILFIDELNRSSKEVHQELMQLILEFRINDTQLPRDMVYIITAGNPEVDDYNDYQVNVMNNALNDRFFHIEMESDADQWIKWAMRKNSETGKQNVPDEIIEFMSDKPELLNQPNTSDVTRPTPRGWDMVGKTLNQIKQKKLGTDDTTNQIFLAARCKVGLAAASALKTHLDEQTNKLLKAQDIFGCPKEKFEDEILPTIKNETMIRSNIITERCVRFLVKVLNKIEEGSANPKLVEMLPEYKERYIKIVGTLPKDLMFSVLKSTYLNQETECVHNFLVDEASYRDTFYDVQKRFNSAK